VKLRAANRAQMRTPTIAEATNPTMLGVLASCCSERPPVGAFACSAATTEGTSATSAGMSAAGRIREITFKPGLQLGLRARKSRGERLPLRPTRHANNLVSQV
jgi:hypothetical protein